MLQQTKKKQKSTIYNFGAGPAMMPDAVMQEVHAEWFDWQESGMSIVEVGHRTPQFMNLMVEAENDLRALLNIPESYHVLFLGGSARAQFGMIPLNLLSHHRQAGYLVSGMWSEMAYEEAKRLRQAYCIASSVDTHYCSAPTPLHWQLQDNTGYIYYTSNETVNGVCFEGVPPVGQIPLVADMTSSLLSEPLDINNFGLIFAGSQKNIAPAGLTIVIVRKDLLETTPELPIPSMWDYRVHATNRSLYATPPTFNCYMAAKMFQWIKDQGGVAALQSLNLQKSSKLYDYIDSSSFYHCGIEKNYRSVMNVCFQLVKPDLETLFVEEASQAGLRALKGHKK